MLLILTSCISISVVSGAPLEPAFADYSVCHPPDPNFESNGWNCTNDGCEATELAPEHCTDLGDGIPRCYWTDKNVIHVDKDFYRHRICTWHGDSECKYLDGTWYDDKQDHSDIPDGSYPYYYMKCLRCCPNTVVGKNLCTETISTGMDPCGTVGEVLLISAGDGPNGYSIGNIAPCCPGEVCLDNKSGICGVADEACDECTKWSYIINGENEYHSGDSCGEDLMCLDDGSEPIENYKPLQRYAQMNYERPEEPWTDGPGPGPGSGSGGNRVEPPIEPIIYQKGICIPKESMGECFIDDDCPGDCLRCCGGKCKRIRVTNDNQECGFDGRGPCCKSAECCDNECVTSSPSTSPTTSNPTTSNPTTSNPTTSSPTTPSPTYDDDDDDEQFAARLNGLNEENNDGSMYYKYKISLTQKTEINLLIILVIGIVMIVGCVYYRNKKTIEYGIDERNASV